MARRIEEMHTKNPFIAETIKNSIQKWKTTSVLNTENGEVVDIKTGEIVGLRAIVQKEFIETNQFVKLYVKEIGKILSLNSAGKKIFKIIIEEMAKHPRKDTIGLNYLLLSEEDKKDLPMSTFFRGVRDCIEARIIAPSTYPKIYFINPSVMFNGDRISIVKEYYTDN